MLVAPSIASARDRYDKERSSRRTYSRASDYGYNGRNTQYGDYRSGAYRNRTAGYRDYEYSDDRYGDYRETRSTAKSAVIIGGSAATGAVVGALAGGGKGAAIGAAVGGVGGLIYDRATRKNGDRW